MTGVRIRHVLTTLFVLVSSTLRAQGAIGLQGYGYPPGQLTVRAATSGGGLAEFDQAAPLNPAALMNWGVAGAYIQYAPERRTTTIDGTAVTTTVSRFPVFAIGLPAGQKYSFGISSSTLLERNYSTQLSARQLIRRDSVTTSTATTARGALNDVRFGAAMQVTSWLRAGTALHVLTGENRVRNVRSIAPDTGARLRTKKLNAASMRPSLAPSACSIWAWRSRRPAASSGASAAAWASSHAMKRDMWVPFLSAGKATSSDHNAAVCCTTPATLKRSG